MTTRASPLLPGECRRSSLSGAALAVSAGLLVAAGSGCVVTTSGTVGMTLDTEGNFGVLAKLRAFGGSKLTPNTPEQRTHAGLGVLGFELGGGYDFSVGRALFMGDFRLAPFTYVSDDSGFGLTGGLGLRLTEVAGKLAWGPTLALSALPVVASSSRDGCQPREVARRYHQVGGTLDLAWLFGRDSSFGQLLIGPTYQLQSYASLLCFSERAEEPPVSVTGFR
jgi:hypothetical protein